QEGPKEKEAEEGEEGLPALEAKAQEEDPQDQGPPEAPAHPRGQGELPHPHLLKADPTGELPHAVPEVLQEGPDGFVRAPPSQVQVSFQDRVPVLVQVGPGEELLTVPAVEPGVVWPVLRGEAGEDRPEEEGPAPGVF